jgi:hypothetical protein
MTYIRAFSARMDCWETIGNKEQNSQFRIKIKVSIYAPTTARTAASVSNSPTDHGMDRPSENRYQFQLPRVYSLGNSAS